MQNTYLVARNQKTSLYEVHAQGCKHLMAAHLESHNVAYVAPDGEWVKRTFEAQNEGCFAKLGPCAKKAVAV